MNMEHGVLVERDDDEVQECRSQQVSMASLDHRSSMISFPMLNEALNRWSTLQTSQVSLELRN